MQAEGEVPIDKKTNPVDWWPTERQGIVHSNSYFFLYMYKKYRKRGHHFSEGLIPDNWGIQLQGQDRFDNIFFISYCCFVALEEPSKPLGRIEKMYRYILL